MQLQDRQAFLKNLPIDPGIYQMLDKSGGVLYIGKAKNLKRRVTSYFRKHIDDLKTDILMQQVVDIALIVTDTENEAFLLENTLIKKLRPKYNIVFKDDKTYPYLHISEHDYPRLTLRRETRKLSGCYYGPYPNATAAREVLNILQKIFKLRSCRDAFFRNRSRPCVQYQIKRCTAPCVNYIGRNAYQLNVEMVNKFLRGKSSEIIKIIKTKMQKAAQELDYEAATHYRSQIENLQKIYEQQYAEVKVGNIDAVAVVGDVNHICIQVLFVRNGKIVGSKPYFPKSNKTANKQEALAAFLAQYYLSAMRRYTAPRRILLNTKLNNRLWFESVISEQLSRKITLAVNVRGANRQWLEMAETNAEHALAAHIAKKDDVAASLHELQVVLELSNLPGRLECFDISHTMGEATVASCVVFDQNGPVAANYRRFNITNITKGDDYAAMEEVLKKRYKTGRFPDLVIIDGGKGQLARAKVIVQAENTTILAIAKGPSRKPGSEIIYTSTTRSPLSLERDSSALHLLQRIRDEAHRFAITGHRQKRAKARIASRLENIAGIGSQKRKELLKYFGGMQAITEANVKELAKVSGVSMLLAERIYNELHK